MRKSVERVKAFVSAFVAVFILSALFLLGSCSPGEASKDFMASMAGVDVFIKNGDVNEAVKLLKKSEKLAFSSSARLGIYKRYLQLGEDKAAVKTLEKAYKKLPENPEIQAVYGNYLLKNGKNSEAFKVTASLAGTSYGSVRAEALLKNLLASSTSASSDNSGNSENPLFEKEISSAYYDIYAETGDLRWLRNCALIYLMRGDYAMAASLQGSVPDDSENAFFWGCVQYDSGNYDVAVKNFENVKSDLLLGAAALLASDSYAMLGDFDSAEMARKSYIDRSNKIKGAKVSPALLVNSAIWAYKNGDFSSAYELLVNAVSDYPEYVPGLLTYGKFAWADSEPEEMSDMEKSLRKTDLRTMKMRRYDSRPKFSLDDALSRMKDTLDKAESLGDEKSGFDDLIVERLNLEMKKNSGIPLRQKTAMIWDALEKNQLGANLYPPHLVQFCAQQLLSYGFTEDARELFTNFALEKFALRGESQVKDSKDKVEADIFGGEKTEKNGVVSNEIARLAFGDRAVAAADKMEIWEVEFAAYFALLDGNISAAKRLYEYVNFETGGAKTANASGEFASVSPLCASSSSANLAMIYSSQGEKKKALNLYTLAAGKTKSTKIKSKLLYRIANIQLGMGRAEDARNSAQYAVSLDPGNADARLFLNQHKK